ncbi:MAG TPA: response regulator [Candidatus Margulisiibacteriota bacterium]|nr:response regulator [Candidatus Margulisiibacteriota bacterium]
MPEKKSKILIVDDEPEIVEVLKGFLSIKGFEVMGASSGKEALNILKEHKTDVMLLDIIMPELRGTEVARIVKDNYPNTKVIVLTGYPGEGENLYKDNLLEAFFVKPVKLEKLYEKLTEVLAKNEKDDTLSLKKGVKTRLIFINARLLFVGASEETQNFLTSQFKQLTYRGQNYEIESALNDNEAFQKIPLFNPDIVIFDNSYLEKLSYDLPRRILFLSADVKEVLSSNLNSASYELSALENLIENVRSLCVKNNLIETREM